MPFFPVLHLCLLKFCTPNDKQYRTSRGDMFGTRVWFTLLLVAWSLGFCICYQSRNPRATTRDCSCSVAFCNGTTSTVWPNHARAYSSTWERDRQVLFRTCLSSVIISCAAALNNLSGLRSTVILLDGLTLIFQIDPHVAQGKSDAEESFLMYE